jgi:Flp pilus assembly protein TadD
MPIPRTLRAVTSGERDAVTLARDLGEAEARYGNTTRALQAFEAAQTLDPNVHNPSYERMRAP